MNTEPSDTDAELEELRLRLRLKSDRLQELFPYNKLLTISQARAVADQIASRLKVSGYKTEKLLLRALRKRALTTTRQGFADGKTMEDLIRSWPSDEPKIEVEEVTSELAIAKLFRLKANEKRQLDRERKRRKAKNSTKNVAKSPDKKRKTASKKRNNP